MNQTQLRELVTAIIQQVLAGEISNERPRALVLFTGALIGFEDAVSSLSALSQRCDLDFVQTPSAQRVLDQNAIERLGMTPADHKRGLMAGHDMLVIPTLTVNLVGKVVNGIGDCMGSNLVSDFIMGGKPVIAAKDAACPDSPGKRRWFPNMPEGYAAMLRENLTKLASFGVRLTSADKLDSAVLDTWFAPSHVLDLDVKVLTATDIRGLPAGTNVRVAPATAITALAREAALAEGISISRRS